MLYGWVVCELQLSELSSESGEGVVVQMDELIQATHTRIQDLYYFSSADSTATLAASSVTGPYKRENATYDFGQSLSTELSCLLSHVRALL